MSAGLTERQVQDFAATIAALLAGRCDGRQAVATTVTQVERIVAAAKADALREFVAWVATHRAYNGSDHPFGQSLYNECINGELPKWAKDFAATTDGGQ